MSDIKPLNKNETQEILSKLNEQFGTEKIPDNWKLIKIGKDRIVAFSGSLTNEKIMELQKITFIEGIGVYLGKFDENTNQIRLSIEGTQLLRDQATKNIFELNDEQTREWMKGNELNIQTGKRGFVIIKHKDDFLGTGKASENKITNFVPKERRFKNKA